MGSILGSNPAELTTIDSVEYEVVNSDKRVKEVAELLLKESVLGVDTENTGLDPHTGKPLLLQIGTNKLCYIFPAYVGLDLTPLRRVLSSKEILKIVFNGSYDWKWIYCHYSVDMENIFCCQLAERLLTNGKPGETKHPSLKGVVRKYLGLELRKEIRNSFIDRNPVTYPITEDEYKYSAIDVVVLIDVYQRQLSLLAEDKLLTVAKLEFDVIAPLSLAEYEGICIDTDKWRKNLQKAETRKNPIANRIFSHFEKVTAKRKLFGIPTFNLGSHPQLLEKINKLGFEIPDTREETLQENKQLHPVFEDILEYRGLEKIISTYGEKFLSRINTSTNRLHCSFNQVEADTGRSSSSNPNLQNIPAFDPEDPHSLDFRSCFVAKPGYLLLTSDFSQQELRIIADLSKDPTFYKVYTEVDSEGRKLDVHKSTASEIFGVLYDKVTKAQRKKAKTVNFLMSYGGSEFTLSKRLGIPIEEAKDIIDAYYKKYSTIKKLMDYNANFTLNTGYSVSISGRRRYVTLPDPTSADFERQKGSVRRIGKNNPIQSGGADVTKQAMGFIYKAIKAAGYDARMLMVIHDEFVIEVREDQAEEVLEVVEREMVRGFSHFFKHIPMEVDSNIGRTWEK
jgi:DNA polymerase I-like protein with 3'-5' exonuclease and polymerase domains